MCFIRGARKGQPTEHNVTLNHGGSGVGYGMRPTIKRIPWPFIAVTIESG